MSCGCQSQSLADTDYIDKLLEETASDPAMTKAIQEIANTQVDAGLQAIDRLNIVEKIFKQNGINEIQSGLKNILLNSVVAGGTKICIHGVKTKLNEYKYHLIIGLLAYSSLIFWFGRKSIKYKKSKK